MSKRFKYFLVLVVTGFICFAAYFSVHRPMSETRERSFSPKPQIPIFDALDIAKDYMANQKNKFNISNHFIVSASLHNKEDQVAWTRDAWVIVWEPASGNKDLIPQTYSVAVHMDRTAELYTCKISR